MSQSNNDDPLGPDPNEVGYDTCLDDDSTLAGSNGTSASYCDLNRENNVWVEGVVDLPNGKRGICMLDTMTVDQVVHVLKHDPKAREDLCKVTSDQNLLNLLSTVKLLGTSDLEDAQTRKSARSGLPYYTLFAGRPPYAPPNNK